MSDLSEQLSNAVYDNKRRLENLRDECEDTTSKMIGQGTEARERIQSNVVDRNEAAFGLVTGYMQGWAAGVVGSWNPFANTDTPFIVRNIGMDTQVYGMYDANHKSANVSHDGGQGWTSTTTIEGSLITFLGARGGVHVGLLANDSESVSLDVQGGAGVNFALKGTKPSTVTVVDGTAQRGVTGNTESTVVRHAFGYGGLQLNMGPMFLGAGANSAGPTEEGNVTGYFNLGAVYRF